MYQRFCLFLTACGQETPQIPSSTTQSSDSQSTSASQNSLNNSKRAVQIEFYPASELESFLRENPKVQDMLSRNGKLESILSNNAKAKLTPQQSTSVPEIYNVDYSTISDEVATYEYAEAVMSCNQTFINCTTFES